MLAVEADGPDEPTDWATDQVLLPKLPVAWWLDDWAVEANEEADEDDKVDELVAVETPDDPLK